MLVKEHSELKQQISLLKDQVRDVQGQQLLEERIRSRTRDAQEFSRNDQNRSSYTRTEERWGDSKQIPLKSGTDRYSLQDSPSRSTNRLQERTPTGQTEKYERDPAYSKDRVVHNDQESRHVKKYSQTEKLTSSGSKVKNQTPTKLIDNKQTLDIGGLSFSVGEEAYSPQATGGLGQESRAGTTSSNFFGHYKELRLQRYELFHVKLRELMSELQGQPATEADGQETQLKREWRFVKELVQNLVKANKRIKDLEHREDDRKRDRFN